MQYDAKDRLSSDFLKSVTPLEQTSSSPVQYLVRQKGRTFLIERCGECEFQRCQAVCCRMLCLNLKWNDYLAGFAEQGACAPLIHRTCRYLAEDLLCRRWNTSQLPRACRNFPVPGDPMYIEVMEKCFFYFVLKREVKESCSMDRQTC